MTLSPDDSTILLLYVDLFVSKLPPPLFFFRTLVVRCTFLLGPNRHLPFYWGAGGFAYVDRSNVEFWTGRGRSIAAKLQRYGSLHQT